MGEIDIINDAHKSLLDEINKSEKKIDTKLVLPELDSNMQGLINIRNGMFKLNTCIARYKELIVNDTDVISKAGNEFVLEDMYDADRISQSGN